MHAPELNEVPAELPEGARDLVRERSETTITRRLMLGDVLDVVESTIGGMDVATTYDGRERYRVNVRYPREVRDSLDRLRSLPIVTPRGQQLVLGDVADLRIDDGPPMLRSENARLSGWVYVDIRGRDLRSAVQAMHGLSIAGPSGAPGTAPGRCRRYRPPRRGAPRRRPGATRPPGHGWRR